MADRPQNLTVLAPWTPAQRRALAAAVLAVCLVLGLRLWLNPATVDDPPAGDLSDRIQTRLDPNTASAAELALLPDLGMTLARRIVAQRDRVLKADPGAVAFRSADDLLAVDGIGPSLAGRLATHMRFGTQPASRPASWP